jgi:hypothetical protein
VALTTATTGVQDDIEGSDWIARRGMGYEYMCWMLKLAGLRWRSQIAPAIRTLRRNEKGYIHPARPFAHLRTR